VKTNRGYVSRDGGRTWEEVPQAMPLPVTGFGAVQYTAQTLPSNFSAGGAPTVAQVQQAQAQGTSGTTYIVAGALTTIALGALVYFATR
jgi:hypothetical protein